MKFDYAIAGQGIAGSLLAWFLIKQGKKVLVVDDGFVHSSSRVAAGIIHPVTGRRLVKTWQADTLISFAVNCYRDIESALHNNFFNEMPLLEIFTSVQHRNEWMSRSAESDIEKYVDRVLTADQIPATVIAPLGGILLKQTGWLNVNAFTAAITQFLKANGSYHTDKIQPHEIIFEEHGIKWKDYECEKLILCDGYSALTQYYFNHLPFIPAKGEVITIHCKNLQFPYIINQSVFILPLGENLFKAGSTFNWKDLSTQTTIEAREHLQQSIKKIINADFEIVNHQAAIRPTTKNRRPFLGFHPHHNHLAIFNGMGTKGVMMAPYYAAQMASHITEGKELDEEVNVLGRIG